jgi:ribonuclease P protein component
MLRFLKSERLKRSNEFKAVFQKCRKVEDAILALYVQLSEDAKFRKFGISLGRAHGKANLRNRLKRRLREIYRVECDHFQGGYQIILLPRRGSAQRPFNELKNSFLTLAMKAALLPRTTS